MAPPKTISAPSQQQVEQQAPVKQQAKPRKRNNNSKAKQQPAEVISQRVEPAPARPAERTTVKKPTTPSAATQQFKEEPKPAKVLVPAAQPILSKQLTNEENDDTDAGIELDGSSNSGSSVKDMSEDSSQLLIKSNSVSPVMAVQQVQSSLVSELVSQQVLPDKQAAEQGQLEQLTSTKAGKPASKKQQLAANQQVIDADEQQLQLKLEKRKSSSAGSSSASPAAAKVVEGRQQLGTATVTAVATIAANQQQTTPKPATKEAHKSTAAEGSGASNGGANKPAANRQPPANRPLRRFSSQSSQEEGSFCKICEQHVYQMERMLAEKAVYHKRCFRCHQCKIQLRVDNYASHEGQVFCQAHHKQLFQPQVKLDNEDDVDIVAKSTSQKVVDDYLLHRGRLSELSFSFLQPKQSEGIRKRQMIICENEPTELPEDVVRCDTKTDDGIEQLNLNLNNILEKFERATESNQNGNQSQPSSAGIVIEKPSINIKQTLMAFESRLANPISASADGQTDISRERKTERPIVKKLSNLNGFFSRSQERGEAGNGLQEQATSKPLAVRRSESLMMRLKKYESRIAGECVEDDDDDGDEDENDESGRQTATNVSKKLPSIDLSSLKSQWENGDINKRFNGNDGDGDDNGGQVERNGIGAQGATGDSVGKSPSAEKQEELHRIRQQLARKKASGDSVRNIYENAIREAQLQQQEASLSLKRDSSDLSALNGLSTNNIQKQLLQKQNSLTNSSSSKSNGHHIKQININGNQENNNSIINNNNSQNNTTTSTATPTTPNKDHFQLNFSNKANKLKEKFELGLITNSSLDHSDESDGDGEPQLTKLEQIRQEKLEDLSVFTEGEIKAREARSLFQQIDRRISAASANNNTNNDAACPVSRAPNSRSLASIGASMRAKLTSQMIQANDSSSQQQPIRLTNNVKT